MVQLSLRKVGCLVGLLLLGLLMVALLVLFTGLGRHEHGTDMRPQLPDPADEAEWERLHPTRHSVNLDSAQRAELKRLCSNIAAAYSNGQVKVLREWRWKLPGMLEPLEENDFRDVFQPITQVVKDELHTKLNKILRKETIEETYENVADFERHAQALLDMSLLYGDILVRRRDFGVPLKLHEPSVFCRLKSYRDLFHSDGREDMESAATRILAAWVEQIESENGYTRALLINNIAFFRVWGERLMKDEGKTWEEISQGQVLGTTHVLTLFGYTPKWIEEFKHIPRHVSRK